MSADSLGGSTSCPCGLDACLAARTLGRDEDLHDTVSCPCGLDACLEVRIVVVLEAARRTFPEPYRTLTVEFVKSAAGAEPESGFLRGLVDGSPWTAPREPDPLRETSARCRQNSDAH